MIYFNNHITYYDKRLRGSNLLRGLLSFYVACAIGALANAVNDALAPTGRRVDAQPITASTIRAALSAR